MFSKYDNLRTLTQKSKEDNQQCKLQGRYQAATKKATNQDWRYSGGIILTQKNKEYYQE